MSNLFDKEVNTQKEEFEKTSEIYTSFRKPMKKCAMEMNKTNKETRKNNARVKMLLMKGSTL